MYAISVGAWGIQPSEFWEMDVEEWWWLYDAKREAATAPTHYAGTLSKSDLQELDEWLQNPTPYSELAETQQNL